MAAAISTTHRHTLMMHRHINCCYKTASSMHGTAAPHSGTPASADHKTARPFLAIPRVPWSLPYFGTALHHRLGLHPRLSAMRETVQYVQRVCGPIARTQHHGQVLLYLFSPDDFHTVFSHEGRTPLLNPLLGPIREYRRSQGHALGVGTSNGEEWYRVRSVANRVMMRPDRVRKFLEMEQEVADEFINLLQILTKNGALAKGNDISPYIHRWNLETAAYTTFGRRFNWLDQSDPNHIANRFIYLNNLMFVHCMRLVYSVLPWYRWFSTPEWRRLLKSEDEIYARIKLYLNESIDLYKTQTSTNSNDNRFGFISYLLAQEDLTFNDIMSIVQNLFTDGLSTTSKTMTAILYCLATNSEKQEKLRAEVLTNIGPYPEKVNEKNLGNMPYLKAVVKEAFRFFPIGPDVSRITSKEMILSDYRIPAGTSVCMFNSVLLQSDSYFDNPTQFLPERWLRVSSSATAAVGAEESDPLLMQKQSSHSFVLLPFSHGPRMCMGRRFAEQEMYLLLIKLMQNFRITWQNPSVKMEQKFQFLYVPQPTNYFVFNEIS